MTLDLAKLKEAAEKFLVEIKAHAHRAVPENYVKYNFAASQYNCQANPATILALIERLESAEGIVRAFTGDPHIGHIQAARAHMEKHK